MGDVLAEARRTQDSLVIAQRLAATGRLAAGIAHEVNNPLTFVTHFVSLLRRDLDGLPEDGVEPERRERLLDSARTISEGLARVREIVRGLKTFARVDEDGPVPLDVNRALRSAIQLASHPIGMRARLTVELGALPIVRANDGQLCQVFLNLLLNAGQAIPEGAPDEHEVRVRSWSDGAQVYVTFEDSGTGIDPRHLPRLFEPFFTTKRRNVGSGLGLWISREIVHDVGGHLEVESRTGGGSTFTVVLPASSARTLAITTSTAPPPPGSLAALPSSAKVRRVLVVDDEPALRSLLADALSEKAHVVTASSGREARDLLEHDDAFDAILCDVLMPGMSGPELYDWVREHAPALRHRVVFMTGDAYAPSVRGFLSKVTNSTLHKPFRVREVESVLDELYTAQERARS
ncbi:MAG: response regulator [Sandaracinaceae bacterium]|nr:response regulator [Sandaracinaceae bacterium]